MLKLIRHQPTDLRIETQQNPSRLKIQRKITPKYIIKMFKLQEKRYKEETYKIRFKRLTRLYGPYLNLDSNKLKIIFRESWEFL